MEGEKGDCEEEIGELLVALVDELIYNHYFVIDILGKITLLLMDEEVGRH